LLAVFEITKREYHTAEMCVLSSSEKFRSEPKKEDKVQSQQYFRMETIQLANQLG